MKRADFDAYIRRFNAEDPTAFDDYLAPDMKMRNGALEFEGIGGMRDHYENKIWPYFVERLDVRRFVSDDKHVAIEMRTEFTARREADTIFGHVVPGEKFNYHGIIMYDLRDGKFASIAVSYLSFTNTKVDGTLINMGMPH